MGVSAEEVEKAVKGERLLGAETQIMGITIKEEKAGTGIFTLSDVFTHEDCVKIVEFYKKNQNLAGPGGTASGVNPEVKLSTDLKIDEVKADDAVELDRLIYSKISAALSVVRQIVPGYFHGQCADTGYRVQHYSPDGYYHWHIDFRPGRRLALLLYLNDIPEGEGGETEFWYQDLKVRPEAGKLLVFPVTAGYAHRGCTSKHHKLIMTSFFITAGAE